MWVGVLGGVFVGSVSGSEFHRNWSVFPFRVESMGVDMVGGGRVDVLGGMGTIARGGVRVKVTFLKLRAGTGNWKQG